MLNLFAPRDHETRKAKQLYGAVVAGARQPAFYALLGVPDTPEGRLEMVMVMLAIVVGRLEATGTASRPLQQRLVEAFVEDMDDCMRELGIGDLSVPKKVRRAAGAFYNRVQAYRDALGREDDGPLAAAIAQFIHHSEPAGSLNAGALAKAIRRITGRLHELSDEGVLAGRVPAAALAFDGETA